MAIVPRQQLNANDNQSQQANQDEQNEQEQQQQQEQEEQQQEPSYASNEEVLTLKAQLGELRELLGQNLRTSQQQQPAAPITPTAIEDVSDDELEDIITNGKAGGAKKLRIAMNAAVERRIRGLEQRVAQAEQFGIESIGNLSERVADSDLKYKKHPKLGPLIMRALNEATKLDPRLKTDPRILKAVHDKVVGENIDVIMQENTEETQRKARGSANGGGSDPTANNGRNQPPANTVPTPEELLGAKMTTEQADEWCRRTLGYRGGWEEYVGVIKKQREESEAVH